MYCQWVILLLIMFTENKLATAGTNNTESCGKLSKPEPVKAGNNATLVYVPDKNYVNSSRKWTRLSSDSTTDVLVFDSANSSTRSAKYIERSSLNEYTLIIQEVSLDDAGTYVVTCSDQPTYSNTLNLTITDKPTDATAKFDTTMITVHDVTSQRHTASENPFSTTRFTVTNDKNEITYRTTTASRNTSGEDEQLTPSSKSTQTYTSTGPADTTFKKANELTTYLTTKAMSTTSAKDEKVKPSTDNERNHTSLEPAKTTFITTVTPRNQKNDDVSTKGKPEDTTTQNVHRVTTTITSDEKSRNIDQVTPRNQEHNGEPTTRKPEDTTTQKAHGGTSEGASDENHRNNEQSSNSTAIIVTVIVFILVAIAVVVIVVKVMDRKKRKHKIPKGSQEKAHYSRNNDMTGKTGNFKTLEIPEYAQVTHKEQRTIEVKQGTSEKTIPRINNTETNNQLVYAELDLQPLGTFSTFKQSADQNKATEYVSVDFTKMGTIQENEGTPEKNEATEHVSLDLTKNGTIQGNENTQEKNVATEHVSLDLTKTGIIQVNENTPENNATTENLSVDFTKTSTIQENEGTPEKNEATTHVSVDFTTTGTIQRNENTPENNGATENVSISQTKTGTSQENELSPEK